MSEQQIEPDAASAFGGFAAFSDLMDIMAPEEGDQADGQAAGADAGAAGAAGAAGGEAAGGAPAAGTDAGGAASAGGGAAGGPADTGAAGPTPGAPVAGADGTAAAAQTGPDAAADTAAGGGAAGGAGADAAGGGSALVPASWTVEHKDVTAKLVELTTALEDRVFNGYLETSMTEVREEYGEYFTAIEKHPRLLVGQTVPAIGKEGTEVLRDPADARDWQDAVKQLLVDEVKSRASTSMDENGTYLNTLHASVKLFQDNADLVPGTKQFDRELADRFATMAKPYELRGDDGKLNGYTIPVQPIIDSLRTAVAAERAAKPAASVASPPAGTGAAAPSRPAAEPPQAGISSKAGSSAEGAEDYSTLFGTLGLPNFTI